MNEFKLAFLHGNYDIWVASLYMKINDQDKLTVSIFLF